MLRKYLPENNLVIDGSNSMLSKSMALLVTSPLSVIKSRYELFTHNHYLNLRDALSQVWGEKRGV